MMHVMMINVLLGGGCLMSREGVCIWCLTKLQIMTREVEEYWLQSDTDWLLWTNQ